MRCPQVSRLNAASTFSVTFTNRQILKQENTDCAANNTNRNIAMRSMSANILAESEAEFTNFPIIIGKASAVNPVRNRKSNPIPYFNLYGRKQARSLRTLPRFSLLSFAFGSSSCSRFAFRAMIFSVAQRYAETLRQVKRKSMKTCLEVWKSYVSLPPLTRTLL